LHDDHLRVPILLHRNRLILIAVKRTIRIGLLPQHLYRRHHRLLVRLERRPQRRIVVYVRRHHVEHLGEGHQRNKSRVEAGLQCRVLQRLSL
jgi:hypothetical protein